MRKVYMVLSAHAKDYAPICLESLLTRVQEPIDLTLVTDEETDRQVLQLILQKIPDQGHPTRIVVKAEIDRIAEQKLRDFPAVRQFREGHPCWRKITDPTLLAGDGEEVILLDPDLYFPNRFTFDPVPETGVYLMRQGPSCLLPPEAVQRTFRAGYRLTHHVDIGVGMLRAPLDWKWLEEFCAKIQPLDYHRYMHIEAIVWSAYGAHAGGGYLDPKDYFCFRNSYWKRLALAWGFSALSLLAREPFARIKCYHAGGWPKKWLAKAAEAGLFPEPRDRTDSRGFRPFSPYSERQEAWRIGLRKAAALVGIR